MKMTVRILAAAAVCAITATACVPPPPAEPENLPPVAVLDTYGTVHQIPWGVFLDPHGSYDPDGRIVAVSVDLGNGHSMTLPTPGSGVVNKYTYPELGTYTVTLTVTDDDGATATDSAVIEIVPDDDGLPE